MDNIINIEQVSNKTSLQQAQGTLIIRNNDTFRYWDEGCTRYVYVNKDRTKVIKIEKDKYSAHRTFNVEEFQKYKNASEEDKKLMVEPTLVYGMIEMDFVTPIKFDSRRLSIKQRIFASSCRNEVGWNKDGELVCFDLDEFKKY